MPNLAYVGGGGELAYWLERMSQFKNYNINFPMLIRRTSALWIDKNSASKMKKLGIEEAAIFQETDKIVKDFVQKNSQNDLSLAAQKADLSKIFDQIERKAADIDATLSKAIAAEKVKQLAAVEQLETRLVRAEKQKYEVSIQQIKTIKEKLFPAGNLQERHENFTSIYAKQGDVFFETLRQHIDCFDARFLIIKEE